MAYPWSLQEPPPEKTPNPYVEPTEFRAGDTFLLRKASNLYPPSAGWTVAYYLRGGGTKIDLAATVETNGDYLITATATTTASWSVGQYTMSGCAIKSATGERHEIYSGYLNITTDLAAATATVDLRTHARKVLEAVEAVIEGRAGNDILDSTIDNTQFRRLTPEQLTQLHSYYSAKVRSEEAKARVKSGRASGRIILARFSPPI